MARILVIDDCDILCRALAVALSRMNHQVTTSSSSELGLAKALASPPELALLDYRMPGLDGAQVLAAMRDSLGERCPRILFVSATPREEVLASLPEPHGAVSFLRKPFLLEDLAQAVAAALGHDASEARA